LPIVPGEDPSELGERQREPAIGFGDLARAVDLTGISRKNVMI